MVITVVLAVTVIQLPEDRGTVEIALADAVVALLDCVPELGGAMLTELGDRTDGVDPGGIALVVFSALLNVL